ncbi:hypothetical protein N9C66_07500 [Akkermansiaceae bacterium]|nr:hypothetical protein [Akkermansiaceae bacterium]MDA7896494.1 hypothetical protein [bacterium]MDA7935039.1 hypothetical protein [Akkermansiaceae bacterium]MDA9831171.1 hypothetical protein [Akkermansiaceae bacterium]MDB4393448.1 hypothetical protein [bacterium]
MNHLKTIPLLFTFLLAPFAKGAERPRPIQDHIEMGFSGTGGDPDFAALTARLSLIPDYRVLFSMTFGDADITEERLQKSIAQFVRSIQSFDSKYDAGRSKTSDDASDFPNFTAQENEGKRLFMRSPTQGGAGCAACHVPPTFDIDPASGNNGVIGKIGGGRTSPIPGPRVFVICSDLPGRTALSCTMAP